MRLFEPQIEPRGWQAPASAEGTTSRHQQAAAAAAATKAADIICRTHATGRPAEARKYTDYGDGDDINDADHTRQKRSAAVVTRTSIEPAEAL
jgi:hypothetical protein